jgi:acetyl esterase/lipase
LSLAAIATLLVDGLMKPTRSRPVSSEALEFIAESSIGTWRTLDLSPEGIAVVREDNSAVAKHGCDAIIQEFGIEPHDDVVCGVAVQWVTPRSLLGSEVILYFFGGGFLCGSPEDDLSITARLAEWTGRAVCVPRYSLAPECPYPKAREEALAVYQGLNQRGLRLAVVGESAGGNLALGVVLEVLRLIASKLTVGALCDDSPLYSPLSVALLSPWIDLTHSGRSHAMENLDPTLSLEHFLIPATRAYIGVNCDEKLKYPPNLSTISLLFSEFPSDGLFPPVTISTGTRDLLMSDSLRLAEILRIRNTIVDLQVTEGMWHVFEWYPKLPEAEESLRHMSSFLLKYLNENSV